MALVTAGRAAWGAWDGWDRWDCWVEYRSLLDAARSATPDPSGLRLVTVTTVAFRCLAHLGASCVPATSARLGISADEPTGLGGAVNGADVAVRRTLGPVRVDAPDPSARGALYPETMGFRRCRTAPFDRVLRAHG